MGVSVRRTSMVGRGGVPSGACIAFTSKRKKEKEGKREECNCVREEWVFASHLLGEDAQHHAVRRGCHFLQPPRAKPNARAL